MTPQEQAHGMLKHLDQTEHVLRVNLEEPGLDANARAHIDIALAHTREAVVALKTGCCRTVYEVVQEHGVFARRLQATLQKSIQHFCAGRTGEGTDTGITNQTSAHSESLTEADRRQQLNRLETAEDALRSNLHLHLVDPAVRAHMERALSHVHEGYVAVSQVGKVRTVFQLAEHLQKAELLFNRLRQRQGAVTSRIRL